MKTLLAMGILLMMAGPGAVFVRAQTTRPAEVTLYVSETAPPRGREPSRFAVVIEVTNRTDHVIRISHEPFQQKLLRGSAQNPPLHAVSVGDTSVLRPQVYAVYPDGTPLSLIIKTGRTDLTTTDCEPGKTVLIKLLALRALLQPEPCDFVVVLSDGKSVLGESQPVHLFANNEAKQKESR